MTEPGLLVHGSIPPPLERDLSVVGNYFPRVEAFEKVTGRAQYAGDIKLPGMLHAMILRSPYSSARIRSIDTSAAGALPGVKAVLTKDNTPGWFTYWYLIPQEAFPEIITFAGQEVAAVAAETPNIARKALELIKVEYEPMPVVLDTDEAIKETSPIIQNGGGPSPSEGTAGLLPPKGSRLGNIFGGKPFVLMRGDLNRGFAEADKVFEDTFTTPFQHHGTLQTRTCVANWEGDKLTVYESSQGVWQPREQLAKSLGLPVEKVRVIVKYQGGGFGSKAGAQRFAHYASKLSIVTGKPVRLQLTRREEFVSHPRRASAKIYFKTGVKMDGTITAVYGRVVLNIGSGGLYQKLVDNPNHAAIEQYFQLYKCPNVLLEQFAVFTNHQYTGPCRSPHNSIGSFATESHIDRIATELGIDPLDFRLKNYAVYADQTKMTPYSSKRLDKCMELVTEAIGWDRRGQLREQNTRSHIKRGMGMANYVYHGIGAPPYEAYAEIVIQHDGSITLHAGIVDMGTGSATTLSMIAAEELGVNLEDVKIVYGDSNNTLYAPASHASRVIPEMGPAVLKAASDARQRLFEFASPILKAGVKELESKMGVIYVRSDTSRQIPFKDACKAMGPGVAIKCVGSRAPNPTFPWFATFGSQAAEVEVDTETGKVTILKGASDSRIWQGFEPEVL